MKKTNKINAEEMRVLIKGIYELSQKLSGNIPIKNLDNAAEFAVNLFGYKNWKEFKNSLNKDIVIENIEEMDKDLLTNSFSPKKDKIIFNVDNYLFKTRKDIILNKKDSDKYTNEVLIGSHLTKGMKTKQPRGLMAMDCVITSNYNEDYKQFVENQISWLIENNQDFIIFSKKYINEFKFPESVIVVDKNNVRLNPIKAIINTDLFESFFRVENSSKSFSYLWSFLTRKFHLEGKELNINDLLNMTDLEKLLEIKKLCTNDFVAEKMLSTYLNKYIIEKEGEGEFLITQEKKLKHYNENTYLINKLKKVKELYDSQYFSEENEFSLKEAIYKKKKCIIKDFEDNIYHELIVAEYISANNEFKKDKDIVENKHLIWVFFLEAESWISKYQSYDLNYHMSFAQYYYINGNYEKIDKLLNETKQILFLRQSMSYQNSIWKDRMLNTTEDSNVNFWYNNNLVLKNLNTKEAILWRTTDDCFATKGLENFILEKIELY